MREGGAEEGKAGWILIDSRNACYVALRTLGLPDQDDPRFEKRAMGNCNLCFGGGGGGLGLSSVWEALVDMPGAPNGHLSP